MLENGVNSLPTLSVTLVVSDIPEASEG